MRRISVVIITKNEEGNIRDCVESVKWADEIVVVDDYSTDKTVEICREYPNVKIYLNEMKGFGSQKQYALDKASYEWILFIDADERVTPELGREIIEKINKEHYDGYYLRRNNFIFGKWMLDYKPRALRVFKKESAKFNQRYVHEAVILKGKAGALKESLIHIPRSCKSIENYISTYVNRYSSLAARDFYKRGIRINRKNFMFYFVLKPKLIFIQKFLLKRGYKDGWEGFLLSFLSACAYIMSYAKLWEMQRKIRDEEGI